MRAFADFHHGGLQESLRILFVERLGWEFYRPVGTEWYTEGYWMVYDAFDTAQQFLGLHLTQDYDDFQKSNPTHWLNNGWKETGGGVYAIPSQDMSKTHYGIRLEAFKSMKFDIIISSMPQHFAMYERLRQQYQPQAKHIFQMGNCWVPPAGVKNLMNSTSVEPPDGVHHVRYHQEFDTTLFKLGPCPNPRSVINMMHYQPPEFQEQFTALENHMRSRGWVFHNHGAGNRDGAVFPLDIPAAFQNHGFVWHNKRMEGYGYNLHQAVACGRPVICHRRFYKGMIGEALLTPHTCIDQDEYETLDALADALEMWAQRHEEAAKETAARFKEVVDFDAEAKKITHFLNTLH